ncbi:hypothetical protein IQ22_03988 [Pseudomonas duriflava]|uniref:Uncharacterized protein n=1 Tax=Pseudomonas duriflava TaxID=459528 RepID=A0A562PXZ5_9PSED|nr:cell wall-binding repeat 2 family protein [Pseudomonas duriflava]TWI49289.1 hypothetical protein IQ22_03988 [Pseudomonas duriflava]
MSHLDDAAFFFKTRLLTLEPGMYILRYASQLPETESCLISLQQAPIGKGTVDFFPGESVVRNTLAKLGDCLIARVKNGLGTLLITEYQLKSNSSLHTVDLRIDRIDTSAGIMRAVASTETVQEAKSISSNTSPSQSLNLVGHIESLGEVSADHWLGAADQVNGITGFAILWPNKPQGVDIAYSCRLGGTAQPAVLTGNFTGSRQESSPITALTMTLVGSASKHFKLDAQLVFLGEPPITVTAGQECFALKRQSKLVAIRVAIVPSTEINAARYTSPWDNPLETTQTHILQS